MSLQDTIEKFKQLPPNIQQALSSDEAMAKMEALENKYNLKLASFVLRAAVREFPFEDLGIVIRKELNLKPEQAGLLKDELLDQIFASVADYYSGKGAELNESAKEKLPAALSTLRSAESAEKRPAMKPPMAPPRPTVMPPRPPIAPSTQRSAEGADKKEESSIKNEVPVGNQNQPIVNSQRLKVKSQSVPPPQPPKSRSYFYFDAEDEKDVEKFKKHEAVISGGRKDFIERVDKAADDVINRSLVNIPDDNFKRRLKSYLTAYLRGIRDILQTKESLAKPFANGGMEFDAVSIEKIMALAKEEFKKIHSAGAEIKNESGIPGLAEAKPMAGRNQESGGGAEKKAENVEKQELSSQIQPNLPTTTYKLQPTNQPTIRRERPQVVDTGRPKVSEVKPPARLTGPIDEIEQMNLNDLRRFAQNHQGFIDRTKERLKILEDESFEKRVIGIAAWRRSFLYRQYLDIIQDSLERNISIPEMIGNISETESQNMSLREWETVNRLNRELKT